MTTAENFRQLHVPGSPFLLPNAWDVPSARVLAQSGFGFIGTTSLGVACVADKPDGTGVTRAETIALARSVAAVEAGFTVDIEGGFDDDPSRVADLVAELASFGVVGVNIEDGRFDGTLAPVEIQIQKIRAIKRAAPGIFVNARTDPYWVKQAGDRQATALERSLHYCDAGADGVFIPGAPDLATVAALTNAIPAPLNVLFQPHGPSLRELGEAGVARVSSGSLLFRRALGAIAELVDEIRAGGPISATRIPSYAELQAD